jgi:tetratricopeptide (TPR) repeat protein
VIDARQRDVAGQAVEQVFVDVARGNLQERWLDVFTFKLMALRNPVTEDAVVASLIDALDHESSDVRRLAARSLSAVKSDLAVTGLIARLAEDVEPAPDVVIEVINTLGIIGDPRAEEAVRAARVRAGQYGYIWNQTELAYRMIPLPKIELEGKSLEGSEWNELGNALLWKGQPREALTAFSSAIEKAPGDAKAYNNRAIVLRQLGHFSEALADYDKVLELNPGDVLALNNRSLLHRQMENYEAALSDIAKVVNTGTLGVKALRNRSIIKRFMGDFRGAHDDLQLALREKPNDERTYSAIAGTWIWTRDWEQALGALDQAISLNDKYTYALTQRALVYDVLERTDSALVDIDRVLSLDPADNYGRRMRAVIFMKQGQHPAAKRDLDYCLENQCINDRARRALRHAQRAVVYFAARGEYEEALDDLAKALDANPRGVDAFGYHLAALAIAMRAGESKESQEARFDTILREHGTGDLWHNRVTRLLNGTQDYDELLANTRRPLEYCAVALAGGIKAERSGNVANAVSHYKRAHDVGNPHDLSCILAILASETLE